MSPEQVLGRPYSYPSDAWSFGCIGFELLTLRRCIKAKNFPDLALKIVDPQQVATYQQELLGTARHRAVDPAPEPALDPAPDLDPDLEPEYEGEGLLSNPKNTADRQTGRPQIGTSGVPVIRLQ